MTGGASLLAQDTRRPATILGFFPNAGGDTAAMRRLDAPHWRHRAREAA